MERTAKKERTLLLLLLLLSRRFSSLSFSLLGVGPADQQGRSLCLEASRAPRAGIVETENERPAK